MKRKNVKVSIEISLNFPQLGKGISYEQPARIYSPEEKMKNLEKIPPSMIKLKDCLGKKDEGAHNPENRLETIMKHGIIKKGDVVLMRDNGGIWEKAIFDCKRSDILYHAFEDNVGRNFDDCIPFAGFEYLEGTDNEQYK